ncbi:ImmA/IrrE family metallo-endopeptidase [Methanobrevibacter olleyae]|uniref:Zn-dependent peptidase ImmA, M78 family n=1 Tax=Methanobrevibacter olleyae TaxID=294671 RepID=A0A126QZN1_METOL|nr:ImmA/IrrE family metallo-endopeptidase [Methanobrevibacter olleyae]AMK15266.1 hypothetical protein YLM1_0709 [Methanobrevibacter olleyae]SFL28996.1 Zn-dependent peptidase ImmA, M78 family [Methanobrevibacter olleyae]
MNKDYLEMNELACGFRRGWKIDMNESIDIFSLAINKIKNLTIVFKKMDNGISGACLKLDKENIMFVNSIHRKGRQAFTIAHELYHLKYDDNDFNICGVDSDDEIEKRADLFASCLLMPHGAIETYKLNNNIKKWNLDLIIDAEQYFQISHQSLLWRLRHFLNEISYDEYISYKEDISYNASIRGYDLSLYTPYLNKEYFTIGNYIKLVELAYEKDLISRGKKEELFLDAFREDIVYKFSEDESF